jgi:amino-acid N-acetyltransferase
MVTTIRAAEPSDWAAVERLLLACDLPVAGARDHFASFAVAEADGIVGCAGAEVYGEAALLRSLAVREARRGQGIARALVDDVLARLGGQGVRQVALLTTTAESFFAQIGFAAIARESLPRALHASEELKGACPASAVAMTFRL